VKTLSRIAVLLFLLSLVLSPRSLPAQIPSGYVQTTATVPSLPNGTFGAAWTNLSSSPTLRKSVLLPRLGPSLWPSPAPAIQARS